MSITRLELIESLKVAGEAKEDSIGNRLAALFEAYNDAAPGAAKTLFGLVKQQAETTDQGCVSELIRALGQALLKQGSYKQLETVLLDIHAGKYLKFTFRSTEAPNTIISGTLRAAIFLALKFPKVNLRNFPESLNTTIAKLRTALGPKNINLNDFFETVLDPKNKEKFPSVTADLTTLDAIQAALVTAAGRINEPAAAPVRMRNNAAAVLPREEVRVVAEEKKAAGRHSLPELSPIGTAIKKLFNVDGMLANFKLLETAGTSTGLFDTNRAHIFINAMANTLQDESKDLLSLIKYLKGHVNRFIQIGSDSPHIEKEIAPWLYMALTHPLEVSSNSDLTNEFNQEQEEARRAKAAAQPRGGIKPPLEVKPRGGERKETDSISQNEALNQLEKILLEFQAIKEGCNPEKPEISALRADELVFTLQKVKRSGILRRLNHGPQGEPLQKIIRETQTIQNELTAYFKSKKTEDLRGPGTMSGLRKKRGADSNEDKAPVLTISNPQDLIKLTEHYRKLSALALYSEYEFRDRENILETFQKLKNLVSRLPPAQRPVLPHSSSSFGLFPSEEKDGHLLKEYKRLEEAATPEEIYQFGKSCRLINVANIETAVASILNPAEPAPPTPTRHTTLPLPRDNRQQARITELDLDGTLAVNVERYRPNSDGHFISESYLSQPLDNVDKLRAWACATITSFFAAAPAGTARVHLEDGYQPQQLAALISFCEFMGYDYSIGEIQKLRVLASENKLNDPGLGLKPETLAALTHYHPVDPTDDLTDLAWTQAQNTTLNEAWATCVKAEFASDKWQAWFNNSATQQAQPLIPPLGKALHDSLLTKFYPGNSRLNTRPTTGSGSEEHKEETPDGIPPAPPLVP